MKNRVYVVYCFEDELRPYVVELDDLARVKDWVLSVQTSTGRTINIVNVLFDPAQGGSEPDTDAT